MKLFEKFRFLLNRKRYALRTEGQVIRFPPKALQHSIIFSASAALASLISIIMSLPFRSVSLILSDNSSIYNIYFKYAGSMCVPKIKNKGQNFSRFPLTSDFLSCIIVTCKVKNLYTHWFGGRALAKNLDVIMLLDIYGEMLTQKQRDFLEYYYNDDLSLSEIAENEGITRQGVRDSIKRAEAQLFDMEQKLGHCRRFNEMRKSVDEITALAETINQINLKSILSRDINDAVARIKTLAMMMKE